MHVCWPTVLSELDVAIVRLDRTIVADVHIQWFLLYTCVSVFCDNCELLQASVSPYFGQCTGEGSPLSLRLDTPVLTAV